MTVLRANPAIVCWGEIHNEMISIGTPMLLINAILHPVGTMAALLIGRINSNLTSKAWNASLTRMIRNAKELASKSEIQNKMGIFNGEI